MTAPYDLSPRAEQDLIEIARYTIQEWALRRWKPISASSKPRPRNRSRSQGRHVIFYVRQADRIAIIGVPHRAMDVGAHFSEPQ